VRSEIDNDNGKVARTCQGYTRAARAKNRSSNILDDATLPSQTKLEAADEAGEPGSMKNTSAIVIAALVTVLVTASSTTAWAGGQAGSLGLGAEFQLSGFGGLSLNFDTGRFHAGGFLGFSDFDGPDNTSGVFGGRFYYHLHMSPVSDFGIGGSVGMAIGDDDSTTTDEPVSLFVEPGFQIRSFIAHNVCLSFAAGISLGLIDANGIFVTGQPNGIAGVHYYFF
jgi:hypothetical protein